MGKLVVNWDICLALLFIIGIVKISAQRQCPRLQKPWNGEFVGACNRHVGAECQFACREPYRLVGSQVRLCRTDGTWSGRTSACELDSGCVSCNGCNNCGGCSHSCNYGDSTCPALYPPNAGHTDGQCVPGIVGQICFVTCDSGYVREGVPSLTCLENGQWSAQTPSCRRTSANVCESFVILNGEGNCDLEGGVTVCRVSCHPGYMLVGSSYLTCTSAGNWNEPFPSCRRGSPEVTGVCPTLVPSPGGRLVGSCVAASEGDTCQMVCLSGYRPSDTRVLVCQSNGQWSSTLPRCIASESGCPSVQVPSGSTSGSCNPGIPGQSCTITCQAGYTLVGNPTIFCQTDGQWSSGIPSCNVRSCPSLPAPSNGGTSGQCNPGSVGQSCSFLCNGGYTLVGQSTLVCGSDGRWSGNAPVCTANGCPALVPPQNGGLSGTCVSATAGQSCFFSCQAGYNLNGQATLYCQPGGSWSSAAPTCVAAQPTTCSSLVAPDHGYILGTCQPGRVGETCVFSCDNNYVLRGQRTLTCQSGGRWSDYTPICSRSGEQEGGSCSVLNPPPNGRFEECDNRPGGRCIVACEQGYLRSGSRVRTCLSSGFWSGFAPTCTRQVGYTRTTYKVVPLWSLVFG